MIKKTITYTDFNGNERTEDFYFNLTKKELISMELESPEGSFADTVKAIISANKKSELVKLFADLILKSYGEKAEDGRRFVKSPEISKAFSETEAFSDLYMELVTNTDAAVAFVNGIIPKVPAPQGQK